MGRLSRPLALQPALPADHSALTRGIPTGLRYSALGTVHRTLAKLKTTVTRLRGVRQDKTGHWCRGPYIEWGPYCIVNRIPPYIEPYRIDIYDTPQNAAGSLAFGQTALSASRQPDWRFRYSTILFRFTPVSSLYCYNQQTIRLTTH